MIRIMVACKRVWRPLEEAYGADITMDYRVEHLVDITQAQGGAITPNDLICVLTVSDSDYLLIDASVKYGPVLGTL